MARQNQEMPTLEERRELCARRDITLDGKPAMIMGAQMPFAKVAFRDSGASLEWAWPTVARICRERGGAFKS